MMRESLSLVAMACRFPDAPTTQDFWENLKNGHDALSEIPATRWDAQRHYDPQPGIPGKCATTKGYFLSDVRSFDPGFFKIQPEDAEVMDPQQRILLELCHEALHSVGYTRESLSGQKVGVFMGITKSDYQNNIAEALARQELKQKTVVTGILENLIAARIAHYFDLTGPALTLDTACSSSLVALHMAKASILAGDCDMALVGGINLNLNAPAFLGMSAAHALSPGERYHVFDARANGFFMGEGGGVVLLKKHRQAIADNNPILAVLAGSAVNNDGRSISPMAPRSQTQQAALRQAYEDAGIKPEEITLIEAHGTGTPLGDAVEAQTLNAVFTGEGARPVVSTVKPNIGHLLSAAGMGSIIKVLLCFQHRQIPPLLHYGQTRKQLHLESRGFRLNTEVLDVPEHESMIAGINGFGFGGTNAHIVLRAENKQVLTPPYRQIVPDYQKNAYWVGLKPAPPGTSEAHLLSDRSVVATRAALPEVKAYTSRWFAQDVPGPVVPAGTADPYLIIAHPLLRDEQSKLLAAFREAEQVREGVELNVCACDWPEIETLLGADSRAYTWVLLLPLSVQTLYTFFQSLAKSPLLSRCLRLIVVTQGALPMATDARTADLAQGNLDLPLQSGLIWGAASELGVPLAQVDLAPTIAVAEQCAALVRVLQQPQMPVQSVLRGEQLWQRSQRQESLVSEPRLPSRLRPAGVYLLTGGASGIGALISESFARRQPQGRLVLIAVGRRAAHDVPGLSALQARIAAQGSQLHYYRLDISEAAEVRLLCQQILRQYGQLNGVVHAAGQVAPADLRRVDYTARVAVMAPKVNGLRYLREALLELSLFPDFCVAFSSLSAALPGYGRGLIDYVAANHFMDLYAAAVAHTALPLQVIQWGPWQGSGMADHPLLQQQLASWGIQALMPEEGVAAFHDFIDGAFSQALILKAEHGLQALVDRLPSLPSPKPMSAPALPLQSGPSAAVPAAVSEDAVAEDAEEPFDLALEQRLQQLLQDTLAESGLEVEIGPEDNLMDIGIDSLEAIELTKALGDWGYQDLPFALFFECQSIRQVAGYLRTHSASNSTQHSTASVPAASYPLSPIQTSFYLAQNLYERPNYSYFRLSLKRLLDSDLLVKACQELIAHHAQLRAVFQKDLGGAGLQLSYQILPVQQVQDASQQWLVLIPTDQELAAAEDCFVNQHFDLTQAPLFRIGLQQHETGSQLLLLFHHIIFDGISMRNFVQGLWENYRALETQSTQQDTSRQAALSTPPLTLRYADYAQKVLEYRESEAFQTAHLALAAYLDSRPFTPGQFLHELADRHAALGAVAADSHQRVIAPACALALKQRAQHTQTPLQMLYLSAFFKALSQWSGQTQLWVQVANAGRHWPLTDIHRLVGSFADLFPVYADLRHHEGLSLAQSLRQQWNQSQTLQRVGSDQLTRLAQERGIVLPFSFSFAHFDTGWMSPEDQAQVDSTQMRGYHAQTQLGLLISENHHGFYYSINTPHDLFSAASIQDLCTAFEQALMDIASDITSETVSETVSEITAPPDFWSAFVTAPDETPALYTPERVLNYGALRQSVLKMARQLKSAGLESGATLVFWGEASAESIALLLACVALGVTWVPVDPQSPAQRVASICAQTDADLLITALPAEVTDALTRPWRDVSVLAGSPDSAGISETSIFSKTALDRAPDAIAYIIFTSGSTGQPKGVPIRYDSLMRYLTWAIDTFAYGPHDRVLLSASLAFDASLRPILATFMTGGCLCPLTDPVKRDPQRLLSWIREARITVWASVPGLWQALIQALGAESQGLNGSTALTDPLPHLRLTQLGGEVLAPQWVQRWQALVGSERPLVNLYGPTETTLNATCHILREADVTADRQQSVPIGRALPYLDCRVMSPAGEPCQVGESGELWVSGPTLTPGYLTNDNAAPHRSAMTSPFVTFEGQRYYRTGDRVCQDADGLFYYLGRLDRQLKLRGYRLEPAEIEQVLLGFSDVLEARVDALQRPSGAQQLVAWVRSAAPLDQAALQRHLAAALPDYMWPEIHGLKDFPRLPNGKSDFAALRDRLSAREVVAATASHDCKTPALEPIAARVTAVWQQVLKQDHFPDTADFFQWGGDSLLLMQAYLMLQQDWPALPKIARFHRQRRWQDWVQLVTEAVANVPEIASDAVPSETSVSAFALSPSQMGFYLWHQHLERDHSLWEARIQLEGSLDPERFEHALWAAARRHQMLNVRLTDARPPVFVPSAAPRVDFTYRDLSQDVTSIANDAAASGEAAMMHYLAESRQPPLDIFQDSLLRCHLIKQGPQRYLWVVQAHHILADGLSCLILGQDIFAAYGQLYRQRDTGASFSTESALPVLPPLRSQFSDYIALLAQEQREAGEAHQRYWKKVFALPYQAPDLRPQAPASETGFFSVERSLTPGALAAFKQHCQAASSTLFMGVLAAYQRALIALTGQSDLIIGVAHHGRDYALPDIAQIFGCFARTLPLRLPAPVGMGVTAQAIETAQQYYQEAAAHPLDPVAVRRGLAEPPPLQTLLGSQFFMSYMDMSALMNSSMDLPMSSPTETERQPDLSINASASGSHFQPSNQDTDFFLALKQQGDAWVFTLNVHEAVCSPTDAEVFLEGLLRILTDASHFSQPSSRVKVQLQPFDPSCTGPLDAALISYLPSLDHVERAAPTLNRGQIEALKERLFPEGSPLGLERLQTSLGQSVNLVLPFFANEIQPGQAKRILPAIQRARQQAHALGVRVVSLAGLLPALSSYGRDLPGAEGLSTQRLTTGHSTTVVAMLQTIRFALSQLQRPLASCHVAVVGLGSIGEATLDALLATQGSPASLTLVERVGSEQRLQQLADKRSARHSSLGPIKVLLSQASVPPEVYQADLILSAVSARQVIDIGQLRPGTVVIDDSFPHCFDVEAAIARMQQQADVLVIGGGLLQVPDSHKQIYLPLPHPELQAALTRVSLPGCLPGCQLESLLLSAYPELPETLGLVDTENLLQYLPVVEAVGIQAAPLHLEGYCVPANLIAQMARGWQSDQTAFLRPYL